MMDDRVDGLPLIPPHNIQIYCVFSLHYDFSLGGWGVYCVRFIQGVVAADMCISLYPGSSLALSLSLARSVGRSWKERGLAAPQQTQPKDRTEHSDRAHRHVILDRAAPGGSINASHSPHPGPPLIPALLSLVPVLLFLERRCCGRPQRGRLSHPRSSDVRLWTASSSPLPTCSSSPVPAVCVWRCAAGQRTQERLF